MFPEVGTDNVLSEIKRFYRTYNGRYLTSMNNYEAKLDSQNLEEFMQ